MAWPVSGRRVRISRRDATVGIGFISLCMALLCGPGARDAEAQGTTGTIQGTVNDSTGAVLPGATVTAVNVETNVARTTATDARGEYAIEFVPVGTYQVNISLDGFGRFTQQGVAIEVLRSARVDATLAVGASSERVEVRADAPLVDTTHVALGRTVTQEEVLNLPLVDRDLYALLDITAGVDSSVSSNTFGSPGQETLINGSANAGAGSVNYNLDGGANASGLRNTGNVVPNPDAVREFRVVTNNYSAEYGRFAGGVVDVITKSGTNDRRGSVFEFFRNDALNAGRWSIEQSAIRRDPLDRNNFGGTFGGPIVQNRAFFFVSYNGLRQTSSVYKNDARVPTPLERQGDFSQSTTKPRDPLTGQPFPNDKIPADRFDPAALRILNDYVPPSNIPNNLFEVQQSKPERRNEVTLKIDHELTSAQRLTGSYFISRGHLVEVLRGTLPGPNREFDWNQQNFVVSHTWTLGAGAVNEMRGSYVRNFGGRLNTPEISLGDLGSKFQIQGAPSLPQISVSGYFSMTGPATRSSTSACSAASACPGRRQFQLRAEATNAFNIVNLNNPAANNIRASTFGQIRDARAMRQIQLGARFEF